jgi:hypothetical protein
MSLLHGVSILPKQVHKPIAGLVRKIAAAFASGQTRWMLRLLIVAHGLPVGNASGGAEDRARSHSEPVP